MAEKLKIGIIGTGGIARLHVMNYLKLADEVEVVAAADLVPGRAEEFMKTYGVENVRFYPSHKELIDNEKDIDALSVCTYNTQHANVAIYALEHDIPVLLEKPFAVTLDEAVEVCRAEKKSRAFVSLGFQPRFDANMKLIKKIVEDGTLGRIYYIQTGGGRRRGIPGTESFVRSDMGGIGAVGDIGCYSLDMVLNALGYPKPLTVSGYMSDYFGKSPVYNPGTFDRFGVDDFAAAFVRLEGDIVLDFRISWAMHAETAGDTYILGTDAALKIPSDDCWNSSVGPLTIYRDEAGQHVKTIIPKIFGASEFDDLFYNKISSFVNAVKSGGPAPIPSSQILINQAIIDGIVKSAKLGHEIQVEIPEI